MGTTQTYKTADSHPEVQGKSLMKNHKIAGTNIKNFKTAGIHEQYKIADAHWGLHKAAYIEIYKIVGINRDLQESGH